MSKAIDEMRQHCNDFELILNDLSDNLGYKKLLEFWTKEIKALDDTWQWIPEEDAKRRMEARATKMAYMQLNNILDYVKADLEQSKKVLAEMEAEVH